MARYYSTEQLRDLFNTFFSAVDVQSCGQGADAVPLPSYIRPAFLRPIGPVRAARLGNTRGGFLFTIVTK
jgi:hypothetical protein